MNVVALIPAAGFGSRMGAKTKKQYLRIGQRPILFYTLSQFERCDFVSEIILAVPEEDLTFVASEIVDRFRINKVRKIVAGGKERQDSVRRALEAVEGAPDLIMVHDGVRPFVTPEILEKAAQVAQQKGASVVGIPASATMKRVRDGLVQEALARQELWEIQTPQTFRTDWFRQAVARADADGFVATDDAALLEHAGFPVHIVEGNSMNVKITRPEDLKLAACLLRYFDWPDEVERQTQ